MENQEIAKVEEIETAIVSNQPIKKEDLHFDPVELNEDDMTAIVAMSENLETAQVAIISDVQEYLDMDKNDKVRCYFWGFDKKLSTMVEPQELKVVAVFVVQEGTAEKPDFKLKYSMATKLVGVCFDNAYRQKQALEITCLGKKASKNSKFKFMDFDVRRLNVSL